MRDGPVPGGFSTETGRCAVFFTVVDPMDDEQDLRETFLRFTRSKNRASQKYLGTTSRYNILVQFTLKKEDCDFTKQGLMRSSTMTYCLPSSLRKQCAWKLKNSFTNEKAQDHVLFSELSRNVNHKIYRDKKQDHLGKHKAMHRASGKPGATLWITESQAYPSQQFNSRMNKDDTRLPS